MPVEIETETTPAHASARGPGPGSGGFRHPAVWLLAALACLFVSAPFVQDWPNGRVIDSLMISAVMIFAVMAVAGRGRHLLTALLLVVPALVARWVHHLQPGLLSPAVYLMFTVVFFAYVVARLLAFVLHVREVDANVLCAGLSGYVLLGLLWIPAYMLAAYANPAAFSLGAGADAGAKMDGFHAFYFSFVTLCTVGYGDVVPVSKAARMLAVVEAIAGLFYVTVFISRLVAIYSTPPAPGKENANSA